MIYTTNISHSRTVLTFLHLIHYDPPDRRGDHILIADGLLFSRYARDLRNWMVKERQRRMKEEEEREEDAKKKGIAYVPGGTTTYEAICSAVRKIWL